MSQDDLDGFLGGGAPGLPFPVKKTSYTLTVTDSPYMDVQRDFDTGEAMEWSDGNPRKQLVIPGTIPEDEWWDEYDDDNEGEVRLFIKWGGLRRALQEAMKKAKRKAPEVGGVLVVTYVKDGPKEGKKFPPKVYSMEYTPPKRSAKGGAEDFLGTDDEDEEEAPPKRRRAAPVEEDEAPPKRRRRSAPADDDDDDEAPPPRRRRAAPVEDDEDEDDAPPPKRRRSNVTQEVATAKRNAKARAAKAAEDDEDDDDEPPF